MAKAQMTPAALQAALSGDIANAVIAMTPGGIEAQEAMEQQKAVRALRLPKDGTAVAGKKQRHPTMTDRQVWESMGFVFGDAADDIFVNVGFPMGWELKPTEHSMWNDLLDDKGRRRAAMFYDRSAHINLVNRFSCGTDWSQSKEPRDVVVKDGDKVIHIVGTERKVDWQGERKLAEENRRFNDELREKAGAWMKDHYPNWEDPTAYWD